MAALKITCPSCGAGIKVPDADADGTVVRCPKCGKGFPLAMGGEEGSAERRRSSTKKRLRPGMTWGFA